MKNEQIVIDEDGYPIPPLNHGEFDSYVWYMKYITNNLYTKEQQIQIEHLYDQYFESIIDYDELKAKLVKEVGADKISEYREIGYNGLQFRLKEYYSKDDIADHIAECENRDEDF